MMMPMMNRERFHSPRIIHDSQEWSTICSEFAVNLGQIRSVTDFEWPGVVAGLWATSRGARSLNPDDDCDRNAQRYDSDNHP
jgi:hypothetical protein